MRSKPFGKGPVLGLMAAMADPDAQPLSQVQLSKMFRIHSPLGRLRNRHRRPVNQIMARTYARQLKPKPVRA